MEIYVGNMSSETTEEDLRKAFEKYGSAESVTIVRNKESGKPRGFGFVEMSEREALAAINGLRGTVLRGHSLVVNRAHSPDDRRGGESR